MSEKDLYRDGEDFLKKPGFLTRLRAKFKTVQPEPKPPEYQPLPKAPEGYTDPSIPHYPPASCASGPMTISKLTTWDEWSRGGLLSTGCTGLRT